MQLFFGCPVLVFLHWTPRGRNRHVEQPYPWEGRVAPPPGAPSDGVVSEPVDGAPTAGLLAAAVVALILTVAARCV